jgi:hypothetical protein
MEFIPYLIVAAFAAMSAVMFNLHTRVRDLEDAIDEVDTDFDYLDRDLDQDFERLYNDLSRDFEEIKAQLATR